MNPVVVLVSAFVVFLALNVPVSFSMILSCILALVVQGSIPVSTVAMKLHSGIDTFPFLAIPLFILAGGLMEHGGISERLVRLARTLGAKLFTTDYNLGKIAELQSVQYVNINDLSRALRPVLLPGETFNLRIAREGKDKGQGVGYLNDGTMVVVSQAQHLIGQVVSVEVQSLLQTGAGVIVFADLKSAVAA